MDTSYPISSAAWESRIGAYGWLSAATFILCDTISVLPLEVAYIWQARWTAPKGMYLALRHGSIFFGIINAYVYCTVQHSLMSCKIFTWYSVFLGVPVLLDIINVILALRLYALYWRNFKVLCFMYCMILVEIGVQIYVGIAAGDATTKTLFLSPSTIPILGCLSNPDLIVTMPLWVIELIIAAMFFLMMLARLYLECKDQRTQGAGMTINNTLKALARDGIAYFFLVLLLITTYAAESLTVHGPLISLFLPLTVAMLNFAGSHMILDLRHVGHRAMYDPKSFLSFDEEMVFQDAPDTPQSEVRTPAVHQQVPEEERRPSLRRRPTVAFVLPGGEGSTSDVHSVPSSSGTSAGEGPVRERNPSLRRRSSAAIFGHSDEDLSGVSITGPPQVLLTSRERLPSFVEEDSESPISTKAESPEVPTFNKVEFDSPQPRKTRRLSYLPAGRDGGRYAASGHAVDPRDSTQNRGVLPSVTGESSSKGEYRHIPPSQEERRLDIRPGQDGTRSIRRRMTVVLREPTSASEDSKANAIASAPRIGSFSWEKEGPKNDRVE